MDDMRDGLLELERFGVRAGDVRDILLKGDKREELDADERSDWNDDEFKNNAQLTFKMNNGGSYVRCFRVLS